MEPRERKQIRIPIEMLNDHVFGDFSEHRLIEPAATTLFRNQEGDFGVRYMEIPDISMPDGRRIERGWQRLQRRKMRMVAQARRDGMKAVLLYHASVPVDWAEERIVIVNRTGAGLEQVRANHLLTEYGPMSVDGKGRLSMVIPGSGNSEPFIISPYPAGKSPVFSSTAYRCSTPCSSTGYTFRFHAPPDLPDIDTGTV